ncbi:MAG TPA: carboxypeptidase regulatory-like domain-containing protein, partial [Candidatus Kapabacteria bacterium]|nr:carboxypeptidase regulatory-like domain-containing protein [Candidatus Kapabacteria bacterium]
ITYLGNTQLSPGTLLKVVLGVRDTIKIAMKPIIKGDLIGKVTNAATGAPIIGAIVTAIYKGTGHDSIGVDIPGYGSQYTAVTDNEGNYAMQLHAGLYLVRVDARGFTGEWYVASDSVRDAQIMIIFSDLVDTANYLLQPIHEEHTCVISGTVFGVHDTVIAGATVTITMIDNNGRSNDSLYSVSVVTDAKGQYKDTVTCGATYIAFAQKEDLIGEYWKNGFGPLDATRLHIENSVDGINFVLTPRLYSGTVISGTVYGCDSVRSPQFAEVTAFVSKDGSHKAVVTARTDINGFYLFRGLPAGSYLIQAVPANHNYAPGYYTDQNQCTTDWHAAAKIQLLDSAQITGLNIFLHKAEHHPGFTSVNGNVHLIGGASTASVGGAVVSAYDVAGNLVDYGIADSNGDFTIASINIGVYTLSMDRIDYSTVQEGDATTDYELNTNAATVVDAQLDAIASDIAGNSGVSPGSVAILSQNYPNPFAGSTAFNIVLPANMIGKWVSLKVFNALGEQVADLTDQIVASKGNKNITVVSFNAEGLPAGMYIYRLSVAGGQTMTREMLLVR